MVMGAARKGSAYLLAGGENFLKEEFIKDAQNKLLEESSRELNFSHFSARDSAIEDVLTVAKTAPFLSKKRVIVIRDIDKLKQRAKEALLSYLKNPSETSCLILESAKPHPGTAFLSSISGYTTVIRTQAPQYGGLDRWIKQRAATFKKDITKDAIALLKESAGLSLDILSKELEKVVSFAEKRDSITIEDVEKVVGRSVKEDIFALVKYINSRDTSRALLLCKRLLSQGKRVHEIIGLMGWNFRKVLSEGRGDDFRAGELKRKLKLLFTADRALKTGSSKPEFILDVLISELCAT